MRTIKVISTHFIMIINIRATLKEGAVTSLLADQTGNIVGVNYKDKQDGSTKVCFHKSGNAL